MTEPERAFYEERAGILEHEANLPRAEAEQRAREMTAEYFAHREEVLDSLMSGHARKMRGKGKR